MLLLLVLAGANPSWPSRNPDLAPDALARSEQMPDDPEYAPRIALGDCVGQLELHSFTPSCTPGIEDPSELGAGTHVDRAWLLTIGRPEVSIALIDTGGDLGDPDVVARFGLNAGELRAPATSSIASTKHDRNGDGAFTVLDYTSATGTTAPTIDRVIDLGLRSRSDRGDTNGNGLLDPKDLIAIMSDGADSDGNGYVDDIAGWDFVEDDNDPSDPEPPSRGATLLRSAVATANNGVGGAGVCPRCTVVVLRIGRRAMGHRAGLAIAYAVDRGSSAIGLGEVSFAGPFLMSAVAYAVERGVPIVTTAGVGSRSPAPGLDPDGVLVVGGVRHDRSKVSAAKSAVAPDPCSRQGAGLDVVAPSRCDDRGAAIALGIVGLVRSAELGVPLLDIAKLEPRLDAVEMELLLSATSSDLGDSGWDRRTGFGRLHARDALDALVRRNLPSTARITSPSWLSVVDPTGRNTIALQGFVENRRYETTTFEVAFGPGLSPKDELFQSLGGGTAPLDETAMIAGEIPILSLSPDPTAVPSAEGDHALTIRVRLTAPGGKAAEVRRVFFVHRDLEVFPAFPVDLGAAPSPPRMADMDGDGDSEIVLATADGAIHVVGSRGEVSTWKPSPRWAAAVIHAGAPALTGGRLSPDVREPIVRAPVIGDDVVAAITVDGSLIVLNKGGTVLAGFPIAIGPRAGAPILYDLDGDGALEISISGGDRVHAYELDGRALGRFPVSVGEAIGDLAIGSVDEDAIPEIVCASAGRLYVVAIDGSVRLSLDLEGSPGPEATPVLANVDDDGALEIILSRFGHRTAVIDGKEIRFARSARPDDAESDVSRMGPLIVSSGDHPSIADVDGDEIADILETTIPESAVLGWAPEDAVERMLASWSSSSLEFLTGYPRLAVSPGHASVADVDGDDRPEWLVPDGSGRVIALGVRARSPQSWPKLGGASIEAAPALGDLDGDGRTDVAIVSSRGVLFTHRTRGRVELIQWESDSHDNRGTNNTSTPITVRRLVDSEDGCGCTTAGGRHAIAPILIVVILLQRWMCRCTARRDARSFQSVS